ncbi:MAG TPA: 2-C-methyl-D-erythritol 4-phosphate cytidylyltransferase [Chitinivibrionales bacterium]|jgi:2-C-methyl-D-erythritol 4-phosphate cytidylyltransferase|nr:2-C-methyl-D-erythritol 4-phosphate cytidylyltransferase [Chitinivibrionales bacterium]
MKKPINIQTDCIIVAAGSGKRLGAKTPKAFVRLGAKPLFVHSLLVFAAHPSIEKIILVVPSSMLKKTRSIISGLHINKEVTIINGGAHRWQSVKDGVEASAAKWVLIHDCARPFVTRTIIDSVLAASRKYSAVTAATPEVDTIREFAGDRAGKTLDRKGLVRVQTPQLFRRAGLSAAFSHAALLPSPPTDEAMLIQAAGVAVGIAQGDPLNFKITTKEDLKMAEALMKNTKRVDS